MEYQSALNAISLSIIESFLQVEFDGKKMCLTRTTYSVGALTKKGEITEKVIEDYVNLYIAPNRIKIEQLRTYSNGDYSKITVTLV